MKKPKYFLRITINEEGKPTEVKDSFSRYATLKCAREALKRLAQNKMSDPNASCRLRLDKNVLRIYLSEAPVSFKWEILTLKHLQTV